jgi:hypothetical protein
MAAGARLASDRRCGVGWGTYTQVNENTVPGRIRSIREKPHDMGLVLGIRRFPQSNSKTALAWRSKGEPKSGRLAMPAGMAANVSVNPARLCFKL